MVYWGRGLILGCLLPNAVNKLGPLTGQEKTLFLGRGVGPDGQMPAICFPLQIKLEEIKAAAEEPWGIRRILEADIVFWFKSRGTHQVLGAFLGQQNLKRRKNTVQD